ncbi:hypothetical protein B0H66DRAFT_185298 [Apodospora peruviana]|uniref:Uncharacterized protein n=1 Tax=Apodospora peruviana TaxID=516989 RepID=A0AAE0IBB6_9PEZI|nr:hypothetical protein B0H66DRAFT_185298 [Apodospora peruviana]
MKRRCEKYVNRKAENVMTMARSMTNQRQFASTQVKRFHELQSKIELELRVVVAKGRNSRPVEDRLSHSKQADEAMPRRGRRTNAERKLRVCCKCCCGAAGAAAVLLVLLDRSTTDKSLICVSIIINRSTVSKVRSTGDVTAVSLASSQEASEKKQTRGGSVKG